MAAVFGFFSGHLDDRGRFRYKVCIRTGRTGITARYFRIKLFSPPCDSLSGTVSAEVEGADCAIERIAFPAYEDLWDRWGVPELPEKLISGRVEEAKVDLCSCLPEYESCGDDWEAEALAIEPAVPSVGFIVDIRLNVDDLRPGTAIKGIVALSEDDPSAIRGRGDWGVNASPAEDRADLADVAVSGDGAGGVNKS